MVVGRSYAFEAEKSVKPQKIRARYLTWPVYFIGAGNEIRKLPVYSLQNP
jgi:hypothetical protein